MKIYIAHEVPDDKVKQIEAFLEQEQIRNIDWTGHSLDIVRGDFTSVDEDEVPLGHGEDATILVRAILDIIHGPTTEE